LLEIGQPGSETIGPCLDGELVDGVVRERKFAGEAIVDGVDQRSLDERVLSLLAPPDDRTDHPLSVSENVGLDAARLAGDSLRGVATAVDAGGDGFDEDMAVHRQGLLKPERQGVNRPSWTIRPGLFAISPRTDRPPPCTGRRCGKPRRSYSPNRWRRCRHRLA